MGVLLTISKVGYYAILHGNDLFNFQNSMVMKISQNHRSDRNGEWAYIMTASDTQTQVTAVAVTTIQW